MDRSELLNDSEQALRLALDDRQASIWSAIPGIIKAVDLTKMTCEVQPAISGSVQLESGEVQSINYPLLVDVPIVFPGAGGFILTFPISVGDEVLVVFSSRCIDAWWQSGGIQGPMETRMHDLSDGFAIPGPRSQPNVVPAISASDLQIRNKAGTTYLAITADGKIKLVSPADVFITGNLTVSGTIEATGGLTSGAIPFATHVHSGVTTGGGNTGAPV